MKINLFSAIFMLLTKPEDSKASRSKFYIHLRVCEKVFTGTINRVIDCPFAHRDEPSVFIIKSFE